MNYKATSQGAILTNKQARAAIADLEDGDKVRGQKLLLEREKTELEKKLQRADSTRMDLTGQVQQLTRNEYDYKLQLQSHEEERGILKRKLRKARIQLWGFRIGVAGFVGWKVYRFVKIL